MRYRINQTTPGPPWRRTLTPVTQCLIALGLQELQTARKGQMWRSERVPRKHSSTLSTWGCCSSTDGLLHPQVLPQPSEADFQALLLLYLKCLGL